MATSGGTTGTPVSPSPTPGDDQGLGAVQPLPYTFLPIFRYAIIMGINPYHFQQLDGAAIPSGAGCDDIWDQDDRNALAWVIRQAEDLISDALGFYPIPVFVTDEDYIFGLKGVRPDWLNAEIVTQWKYLDQLGTEQLTLLDADSPVTYYNLDNDPDGIVETAIIGEGGVYATLDACSAVCDVAMFFRVTDGAEDAASKHWEIRPYKVDIDGSTMTIKAHASQFVKPSLWSLTEQDCLGSDDPNKWKWDYSTTNLVSAVDVYCRTVNAVNPLTMQWDQNCNVPCDTETQTGCGLVTSKKYGYFKPRTTNSSGGFAGPTYRCAPDFVRMNYRAGYPLDSRCRMNQLFERAIVKLANALLPEPPCGFCDLAERRWHEDRNGLQLQSEITEIEAMNWPVDKVRGALEAARIVKRFSLDAGGHI